MIPTRQELQDIAQSRRGDLRKVPYPVLLYALALAGRSAVLELKRHQFEKQIIFERGVPVDCRSNLAHETLGRFLQSRNRLTAEQLASTLNDSFSRQMPLGQLLIEREIVTPYELYRFLQQNLARKLLDGFSWHDGDYALSLDVPEVDSTLKVRVPQLIITGVMRFARQSEIDSAVGPLIGKVLALHPEPAFPLEEIRLSPRHERVLEALKKRGRIDQIVDAADLSFEEITRLLYALALLGLAVPVDQLPKESKKITPPPSAPRPGPEPPPAATPSIAPTSAALDAIRNDVMRVYLDYRRHNAFGLLGLAEDAAPLAINRAFVDFARRFAPWQFAGAGDGALMEKAAEVFLAAARAYATLSDADQRRSLLHDRRVRLSEEQQPAATRFALKTDLLDPDIQYRKGLELKAGGKLREALTQFEFASDCDSQNGVYRAEAAYCAFLLSPFVATARASFDALSEAIRIDPECGLAHFYAGEMHRQLGDRTAAEKSLRIANKLMAPDRRPIDALKALEK